MIAPLAISEPSIPPSTRLPESTESGANSEARTASSLICFFVTLSLGRLIAAYEAPPRAMNSASVATTFE